MRFRPMVGVNSGGGAGTREGSIVSDQAYSVRWKLKVKRAGAQGDHGGGSKHNNGTAACGGREAASHRPQKTEGRDR